MLIKNYKNTFFLTSKYFINRKNVFKFGKEIAFIGFSNSGKSSLINSLSNNKKLARISKTPGRTQIINFFEVYPGYRLVDLPGYGYSNVSKLLKLNLENMIFNYFQYSECLIGIIIVIDIRRALRSLDEKILTYLLKKKKHLVIVLTKSDKVNFHTENQQLLLVKKKLFKISIKKIDVIIFSSFNKRGVKLLKRLLNNWIFSN